MAEMVTIKIPKKINDRLKKRVKDSEFKNVSEYVAYILDQVIERLDSEEPAKEPEEQVYSKEDEEKVKERLRSLGYLD